jgi:hypothetical protein
MQGAPNGWPRFIWQPAQMASTGLRTLRSLAMGAHPVWSKRRMAPFLSTTERNNPGKWRYYGTSATKQA